MTMVARDINNTTTVGRNQSRVRTTVQYAAGFTIMTLGTLLTLVIAILTLFQMRRFYSEVMARTMARMALRMVGIRIAVHTVDGAGDLSQRTTNGHEQVIPQVVYIANHASTLDVFVLTALGLPNTRFFLAGHLRRILPLGLLGYLAGVFWTVPQQYPEKRVRIFQLADRILRRTGESVFLSPEGNKGRVGLIAPFNKGAFHLATRLSAPIIPLYIAIPSEINPGWGYEYRPGVVDVYFHSQVSTENWKLDDLLRHRDEMHHYFVELQKKYRC